LKSKRIW
jgi:hypothetical protein